MYPPFVVILLVLAVGIAAYLIFGRKPKTGFRRRF
jgi:hypothetical protein